MRVTRINSINERAIRDQWLVAFDDTNVGIKTGKDVAIDQLAPFQHILYFDELLPVKTIPMFGN